MNARSMILSVVALVALTGCQKTMIAPFDIGGSKADGTVIIGGTPTEFEEVDWNGADELAVKRCAAWGYSNAEGFAGIREQCTRYGGVLSSCAQREVTRTYQCLD